VCQHGSKRDITDTFDVLCTGVELVVNDDSALVIELYAGSFEIESFDVGTAAYGDKDNVCFELGRRVSLAKGRV
jgi:hypothetical protein